MELEGAVDLLLEEEDDVEREDLLPLLPELLLPEPENKIYISVCLIL